MPSTFCVYMQTFNVYLVHVIMYACICRILCCRGLGFFKCSHPCLIWAWKIPLIFGLQMKLESHIFPPPFRKMLAAFKIMSSFIAILSMAFWHFQRYNKTDLILASSSLLSVVAVNLFELSCLTSPMQHIDLEGHSFLTRAFFLMPADSVLP